MRPARHLKKASLALVSVAATVAVAILAAQNRSTSEQAPAASVAPQDGPVTGNPLREAYFGDLHVHTGWSTDAINMGVTTTPDDAYLYGEGQEIRHVAGYKIKLSKPLDFMAVTEHAEYLGIFAGLLDPNNPLSKDPLAKELTSPKKEVRDKAAFKILEGVMTGKPMDQFVDKKVSTRIWQQIIDTANRHYKPGEFTTFVGAEWSSNGPKGNQNLHRNLIFRTKAPDQPFSTFDSIKPEDLWTYMENARKEGIEVLAIPHNPNMSDGLMFLPRDSGGKPFDRAYAERRILNEPLVEATQIKGTSETHPLLSPDDEFAGFEISDFRMDLGEGLGQARSMAKGGYVRDAYRMGLVIEEQTGVNPYKFGMIGSSDTHNTGGPYEEDKYFGKLGTEDGTPADRLQSKTPLAAMVKSWSVSGLCGVWAEENKREPIFDALKRKETFATTGPRIRPRLFGGWGYGAGDDAGQDFAKTGYDKGVPMGGDLPAIPGDGKAPTFIVWAAKDPSGANLDRIQIIKGWAKDGQSFEKVYDVVWSGGRTPNPKTGRVPPVGNTVDVAKATYTNTIGSERLSALWKDPDFDPMLRAFYYLRVLEIPTPRWSTFDAKGLGIPPIDPATIQERAFTSPIWYTPSEAQLAKAREKALTVAELEKQKAKAPFPNRSGRTGRLRRRANVSPATRSPTSP